MTYASIIMVTYRRGFNERENLFRQSIASLIENTDFPYELILVDNSQNNRGLGAARNYGFMQSTGDYVVFVDDDILFLSGWLSNCIKLLKKRDHLISTPVITERIGRWEQPTIQKLYRVNNRAGSNCLVMTRETFDDIGYFDERDGNYGIAKIGKIYCDRQVNKGYSVIMPRKSLAIDMGINKKSYYKAEPKKSDTQYLYNAGYFKKASKFIRNPKRLDKLVQEIMSYSPKRVLDVGCGVGHLVERLRELGIDAVGTDFAESLRGYWGDKPYFQVAEANNQPFQDKEFDLVISTDVLEHIYAEDLPGVTKEMLRVGKRVLAFVAEGKEQNQRQALFHVSNQPMDWWKSNLPGLIVYNSRDYQV